MLIEVTDYWMFWPTKQKVKIRFRSAAQLLLWQTGTHCSWSCNPRYFVCIEVRSMESLEFQQQSQPAPDLDLCSDLVW